MKHSFNCLSYELLLYVLICIPFCSCSQKDTGVISPNGKICLSVEIKEDTEKDGFGKVFFNVEYKDGKTSRRVLSDTRIGLETQLMSFTDNIRLKSVSGTKLIEDDYVMLTGKRSHCQNRGNERIFRFENEKAETLDIVFRAYDDGIVFRYSLPSVQDKDSLTSEHTAYYIPEGTKRWIQNYSVGYEGFYPLKTRAERGKDNMWGYPLLLEPADSLFVLITEANILRGHSGSRLYNGNDMNQYQVRMTDDKLALGDSFTSPWRVLMIGSLSDVVESTLVTDVSEPNKISDTSWIMPGSASWVYWAHNHGSKNFKIVKDYIGLAVDMKWPYSLIDAEWNEMSNGGDIEDLITYSLSRNIKPMIWYNSSTAWMGPGPLYRLNSKENRIKEYTWLQKSGVVGVKIDFFPDDYSSNMDYYIDLLEDAAKYKLMVNFHGATIPRGWQRTYPHLMTMEAVYGAEWYNNKPILTDRAAEHNVTLPFTRNVIGSMDYTPGTFSDSQHPHITTCGHELALSVVFESALQHMPDRPEVYSSLPRKVREFLSGLPTAWDDTKLLCGYPGTDIVLARRKGDVWYIGGLNGTNENKILSFSLAPLQVEGKTMDVFKDGVDDKSFAIEENIQLSNDKMDMSCLPRGGFVAVIK